MSEWIDISDRANVGRSSKTCSNLGQGHMVRLLIRTVMKGDVPRKGPSATANRGSPQAMTDGTCLAYYLIVLIICRNNRAVNLAVNLLDISPIIDSLVGYLYNNT